MTDEISSPTTRMPLPDPGSEASAEREAMPDTAGDLDAPAAAQAVGAGAEPPAGAVPPAGAGWQPPSTGWQPTSRGRDHGRSVSVIVGFVLLAIGLWFFAEHTLSIDLPTIRWGQLWPLILIVVGGWVLYTAVRRPR